ncbi:MAG: ATP-binding cassette domain-containing protein [Thermoplasmataceae archaeon]
MFTAKFSVAAGNTTLKVDIAGDGLVGIVGPNGSGKSRTLRGIAGLVPVGDCHIVIGGADVTKEYGRDRSTVYISQGSYFRELTVEEHFELLLKGGPNKKEEFERIRRAFGIDYSGRMKFRSTGQRVRVAVAVAILSGAKLILLDEVTAVISDPESFLESLRTISKESGIDFVIATNQANLMGKMNAAYEIADGTTRAIHML